MVVWVVLFAGGLVATVRLSPVLKGGGFTNASAPAQRALDLMQARLHTGIAAWPPSSLTSVLVTKEIGVGLEVAIALDATIVHMLLVPATMRILGWVNWWQPAWLPRRGSEECA